jgi:hypothetical protein
VGAAAAAEAEAGDGGGGGCGRVREEWEGEWSRAWGRRLAANLRRMMREAESEGRLGFRGAGFILCKYDQSHGIGDGRSQIVGLFGLKRYYTGLIRKCFLFSFSFYYTIVK